MADGRAIRSSSVPASCFWQSLGGGFYMDASRHPAATNQPPVTQAATAITAAASL